MPLRGHKRPNCDRPVGRLSKFTFGKFRSLRIDERGSVLAAGIVILGIFAVLFASGVRHEGSAQALDIFTAHRREALDIARGGIDSLQAAYNGNYDSVVGFPAMPEPTTVSGNSSLAAVARRNTDGTVALVSTAVVSGVRETVTVTLEAATGGLFEHLFGERTLAGGGYIYLRNNAAGSVEEPVYYPPGKLQRSGNAKITFPASTGTAVIPGTDVVEQAILQRFQTDGAGYQNLPDNEISNVSYSGNFVTNKAVTMKNQVQLDGNLVVNGRSVTIAKNITSTITLNGDLIINNGSLLFDGNSVTTLFLNGNIVVLGGNVEVTNNAKLDIVGQGMIISVPKSWQTGIEFSNNTTVNIGDPRKGTTALSIISTGKASLENNGQVKGSLLLYASSVVFANNCVIKANTASVISPGDVEFSNNANVTLGRGAFEEWVSHPDLQGAGTGAYKVKSWVEGN